MSKKRRYTSATEKALFTLSRGYCYAPDCDRPVVTEKDDEYFVEVHIAHICALEPGGLRCDKNMSDSQRNSFGNLILLCPRDHYLIDRSPRSHEYTIEVLHRWKRDREGTLSEQLNVRELDGIGTEQLQEALTEIILDSKDEVTEALDKLEDLSKRNLGISKQTADMVRSLVSEAWDRPYIDRDAIASLQQSSRILSHLPDSADTLAIAANRLRELPDSANTLMRAARDMSELGEQATSLSSAASKIRQADLDSVATAAKELRDSASHLSRLSGTVDGISDTTSTMREVADNFADYHHTFQVEHSRRWKCFQWGIGIGFGGPAALAVAIIVFINWPAP